MLHHIGVKGKLGKVVSFRVREYVRKYVIVINGGSGRRGYYPLLNPFAYVDVFVDVSVPYRLARYVEFVKQIISTALFEAFGICREVAD